MIKAMSVSRRARKPLSAEIGLDQSGAPKPAQHDLVGQELGGRVVNKQNCCIGTGTKAALVTHTK